jgi:hypothetical protein
MKAIIYRGNGGSRRPQVRRRDLPTPGRVTEFRYEMVVNATTMAMTCIWVTHVRDGRPSVLTIASQSSRRERPSRLQVRNAGECFGDAPELPSRCLA